MSPPMTNSPSPNEDQAEALYAYVDEAKREASRELATSVTGGAGTPAPPITEPLYYAKGLNVWKRPIRTRTANGWNVQLGFRVCAASDAIGEDGAALIATMLSAAESDDGASSRPTGTDEAGPGMNTSSPQEANATSAFPEGGGDAG